VGAAGLEPATLSFEGGCSIQLRYAPVEFIITYGSFVMLMR
jgi:hypothetical protein